MLILFDMDSEKVIVLFVSSGLNELWKISIVG